MNENDFKFRDAAQSFVDDFSHLRESASPDEIRSAVSKFIKRFNDLDSGNENIPEISENIENSENQEIFPEKHLTSDEVTEHTASMWKYIPVPENDPEPFPEYKNLNLSLPGCCITASRVRGKKHKHEGSNCDDWFEVSNYGKITCIASADGAGSKKFSRIGAKVSCMTAVSSMKKLLEKLFTENSGITEKVLLPVTDSKFLEVCGKFAGIVQESVINAFDSVETAFKSRSGIKIYSDFLGREPVLSDFASTLLTALIIPANPGENLVITCQIGDGTTALINTDENSVRIMGEPDSGDFSGETDFLTSPGMRNIETLQSRTRISKSKAKFLFMMSDGVADDYFPNETEILRLYSDLILNGVISTDIPEYDDNIIPDDDLLKEKIPEPLGYPCVNDKSKTVFLRYTNRICSALGISLKDLLENKKIMSLVRISEKDISSSSAKMLCNWLDNYVERGSFDDRTLVIAELNGEKL